MINIFSLIFHSLEGLSYWHSTVLKYVCKLTFLSHHESVVITLIKGTLEDLTRAVADKKQKKITLQLKSHMTADHQGNTH